MQVTLSSGELGHRQGNIYIATRSNETLPVLDTSHDDTKSHQSLDNLVSPNRGFGFNILSGSQNLLNLTSIAT
jgi:hypothetical protein